MSPISKGMIAIVLGVFAVLSNAWLTFHIGMIMAIGISLLCSVSAIFLGIKARRGGSKILGLIGLVLGIFGVIVFGVAVIGVVGANSN